MIVDKIVVKCAKCNLLLSRFVVSDESCIILWLYIQVGWKISQVFIWYVESWVLQSHKFSSKSDQKQKKIINRTFFVNKQLILFFNFIKEYSLNFVQNFRECLFNLAGSESGEKSRRAQFFVYISQLFVYKTRLWT